MLPAYTRFHQWRKSAERGPEEQEGEWGVFVAFLTWWALDWCINERWCRDAALWTVAQMELYPDVRSFYYPYGSKPSGFTLDVPGWDELSETEKEADSRVRAAFEAAWREHRWIRRERMEAAGWVRPRENRSKARLYDPMHWLVRWQCQGWGWERIARQYGGSQLAHTYVIRECRRLADEMELTLRKGKPGPKPDRSPGVRPDWNL